MSWAGPPPSESSSRASSRTARTTTSTPASSPSGKSLTTDHLEPAFGSMALDAIGPAQFEDFKAAMRKKPSGARARKDAPTGASGATWTCSAASCTSGAPSGVG